MPVQGAAHANDGAHARPGHRQGVGSLEHIGTEHGEEVEHRDVEQALFHAWNDVFVDRTLEEVGLGEVACGDQRRGEQGEDEGPGVRTGEGPEALEQIEVTGRGPGVDGRQLRHQATPSSPDPEPPESPASCTVQVSR